MLTRRSFLRKAGLAAGAALVTLGLHGAPRVKVKDLHTPWMDVTPTKAIRLVGRFVEPPGTAPYFGKHSVRWDTAHYTLYLDESALEAAGRIAREMQELFATLSDLDNIIITPEALRAANEAWAQRVSDA